MDSGRLGEDECVSRQSGGIDDVIYSWGFAYAFVEKKKFVRILLEIGVGHRGAGSEEHPREVARAHESLVKLDHMLGIDWWMFLFEFSADFLPKNAIREGLSTTTQLVFEDTAFPKIPEFPDVGKCLTLAEDIPNNGTSTTTPACDIENSYLIVRHACPSVKTSTAMIS